jgi:hypothetical protein
VLNFQSFIARQQVRGNPNHAQGNTEESTKNPDRTIGYIELPSAPKRGEEARPDGTR